MSFNWGRFLLGLVASASQEVAVSAKSRKTRKVADFITGGAALTKLVLESKKAEKRDAPSPSDSPLKTGVGG